MRNNAENVLRAIIRDNVKDFIHLVSPAWFPEDMRDIFLGCAAVATEHKRIDRDLLVTHLRQSQANEAVGIALAGRVDALLAGSVHYDTGMINDLRTDYMGRVAGRLAKALRNGTPETHADEIRKAHEAITASFSDGRVSDMGEEITKYLKAIESGEKSKWRENALTLNDDCLRSVFGLVYPAIYTIAGRPGFQKTDILINLAYDFYRSGYNGMFFCLEDAVDTLRNKWAAIATIREKDIYRDERVDSDAAAHLRSTIKADTRLYMDDRGYGIDGLIRQIDNQVYSKKLRWIIVDFIQCIRKNERRQPDHEHLTLCMKAFHGIVKSYRIPVILASQVNDRDENKGGKISLDLGDLKGSGGLEEYSRVVSLICGDRASDARQLFVAKNSFGPVARHQITISRSIGRIKSYDGVTE